MNSEPAKLTAATMGFERNPRKRDSTMTRSHSRGPRVPSVRGARALSARVTGAPNVMGSGASITIIMCSTMCPENVTMP
ncbi:hypothetical protein GCM10025876_20650 [Demequina litorisediminis]|uniref:Uncharacterized protein n=1 Tax=Demequina litorisediminis TaxID=1849022 RepID=A0ABQ6IDW1_9MICO|nr:hypothetical protein GCM10025876_20650 [Demequina litorisediminis]